MKWQKDCPSDAMDVEDLRGAMAASVQAQRELLSAKQEMKSAKKGASPFEDFDEKEVTMLLKKVGDYIDELHAQDQEFDLLKKWLTRVRTSSEGLPCSFVVKGNDKASLHVSRSESVVDRSARAGKADITGSKVHDGTCRYENGKLVFQFEGTARAPWKTTLQKIIRKAGLNMRVVVRGPGDTGEDDNREPAAG